MGLAAPRIFSVHYGASMLCKCLMTKTLRKSAEIRIFPLASSA